MGTLEDDVRALAMQGGREVGSQGHARARAHLLARMRALELAPYAGSSFELPYPRGREAFVNLVGRVPGQDPRAAPVLLGAHYDTAGPLPGADDNAAAIAIVLAIVDRLRALRLARDVVVAFFDAEEPPHFLTETMGSVAFYQHQRRGPVHAALIMDLVGHAVPLPGHGDLLFVTGMETDPDLEDVLLALAEPPGLRLVPTLNAYVGDLSDHHVFRVHRRPYLFLTCGRWEHYHAPTDTPDRLDYAKMAAIADLLLELLPRVAARPLAGPFEGGDTTATELRFMRRALGDVAGALGFALERRADLTAFAERMLALGL